MKKRIYSKMDWQKAVGIDKKPRRLSLKSNSHGLYYCSVTNCETEGFKSRRGCRKHVYGQHGWFYFFDEKPELERYFPESTTRDNETTGKRVRSTTSAMPMFSKSCNIAVSFSRWLCSPGGGGKGAIQSDQLVCKVLKYLKFCCNDVSVSWEVSTSVVNYCMGSVSMISDFVTYPQEEWKLGNAGIIGYMNSLSHMLDFRRSQSIEAKNISIFIASEIYLDRVKKCLSKKMRIKWNVVLSLEYLSSINCWATYEEIQQVIPYHADKFNQIIQNVSINNSFVTAHDLSFSTAFVVALMFILVKTSRPNDISIHDNSNGTQINTPRWNY